MADVPTLTPRMRITKLQELLDTLGAVVADGRELKLQDPDNHPNSRFLILNLSDSITELRHYSNTGSAITRISPQPLDGASSAHVQLWRATNTSATSYLYLFAADGTSTWQHALSNKGDSFLQDDSGNLYLCRGGGRVIIENGSAILDLDESDSNDTYRLQATNSLFQITKIGSAGAELTVDNRQSSNYAVGIGGVLNLSDITKPATPSGAVKTYSKSGELYVLDSAGNETLLSPHNFMREPDPDEPLPAVFQHSNPYAGFKAEIDLFRLAREVESITGTPLVTVEELPEEERETWDAGEVVDEETGETRGEPPQWLQERIASPPPIPTPPSTDKSRGGKLQQRVTELEQTVADLTARLEALEA